MRYYRIHYDTACIQTSRLRAIRSVSVWIVNSPIFRFLMPRKMNWVVRSFYDPLCSELRVRRADLRVAGQHVAKWRNGWLNSADAFAAKEFRLSRRKADIEKHSFALPRSNPSKRRATEIKPAFIVTAGEWNWKGESLPLASTYSANSLDRLEVDLTFNRRAFSDSANFPI